MKRLKKIKLLGIAIVFISFNFFNFSCSSTSIVPGQQKVVIDNIYVEYSNIGDSYFKLEDYTNAVKYYKMAMQNRKIYWAVYYKMAKAYAYSSNWNEALPMYETMLKRDPENNSLKASLAYIYIQQGQLKKAGDYYSSLLEIDPLNEKYLENYLAILMPDSKSYFNNKEKIEKSLENLKSNFPNNKNAESFQNKIEEYEKAEGERLEKENNKESKESAESSDSKESE